MAEVVRVINHDLRRALERIPASATISDEGAIEVIRGLVRRIWGL